VTDIAISADNLSKLYRIGVRQEGYKTLRESIMGSLTAPFRRSKKSRASSSQGSRLKAQITSDGGQQSDDHIWALKDVSFEVKLGEVVGIIGRNGAGKTTLLKILSRITEPTEGRAEIHGRVGSLLEVGTGFHPELTGRENIYLNGAILGMRRAEIQTKFDEIVAFAEVEKFIDTPVKRYSSGMYVRLAFAVAAHMEPEILLVDEVLAVGDAAFQKKCLGKMGDVAREGRTVLFVSHNMGAVNRLCASGFWIDAGRLRTRGKTEEVVAKYLSKGASLEGQLFWEGGTANLGVEDLKIRSVHIRNERGQITSRFDVRKPFWVEICYTLIRPLPFCRVGLLVTTVQGITVFEAYDADDEQYSGPREPGHYVSKGMIPGDLLNSNRYILSVNAGIPGIRNLAFLEGVLAFDIEDAGAVGSHMHDRRDGIIRPRLCWEVSSDCN